MLTLYFAPGASSMAPHIALHEIGIPFKAEVVHFANAQQKQAHYLAVNREGKVPALVLENGQVLTEVAAILYWLARRYPQAQLLADDIDSQAQVISWMSFLASRVHPARRQGLEHAQSIYRLAEQRLGSNFWAVGAFSIADIHLFRLFWRFNASLKPATGSFPHLEAHHTRMMARAAVKKTIEIEAAIGYSLPG